MNNSSQTERSTSTVIEISKVQIKKNQKRNNRKSAEDVMIAVDYLAKVMEGLRTKLDRQPYRTEILAEMKRIGFPLSITTLWRYRGKISKVRTAVRDLLEEGTYSAYFDHNMGLLDDIEEYAIQCYLKTWTNSKLEKLITPKEAKTALEEGRAPEGALLKSIQTGEVASGKAAFLNVLTRVVELRRTALNDENVNLATAALSEEFHDLKMKYEESERKRTEIEKELKQIVKRRKGKDATSSD